MNNVTIAVSDKKFKLLYGASEINAQVERMAKDIKRDMTGRKPLFILKSASNLNGNLNCSKELEHYAS